MAKVLFRVSYSIPDGKRTEYISAITAVKAFYAATDIQYSVFEVKNKHNHFEEVYVYPSAESYEASDDPATTADITAQIDKIYALAQNVVYGVANEVA